ncbi:MAG: ABC transporter permease [Ruminococcaceae bacterium]|nr:ABC transporter permease [Oscillospiraceae bacterium]
MADIKNKKIKRRSQWDEIWRRLRKNTGAMIGMAIVFVMVAVACSVDLIYDYDTEIIAQDIPNRYLEPCAEYWFGTDALGRDVFKRVVYGAKYSLLIGFMATVVSTAIALVLGSAAGYFGGKVDNLIMRFCDIWGAVPGLMLGMIIVSLLGPSIWNLIIAMGLGGISGKSRTVRAAVLTVRNSEYVESARSIGMPEWKIILKYILPNCMSPIIVAVTLGVAADIISASSLSFLGLGVQAPAPEWGAMLTSARENLRYYPYLAIFPGLAIMVTVLALNMFGDGLRDAMDPKLRR